MGEPTKFNPVASIATVKTFIPITLDLTHGQYRSWATLFKVHARVHGAIHHILPPADGADREAYLQAKAADRTLWDRLDADVLQWIYATISSDILLSILVEGDTAENAWKMVAGLFEDSLNSPPTPPPSSLTAPPPSSPTAPLPSSPTASLSTSASMGAGSDIGIEFRPACVPYSASLLVGFSPWVPMRWPLTRAPDQPPQQGLSLRPSLYLDDWYSQLLNTEARHLHHRPVVLSTGPPSPASDSSISVNFVQDRSNNSPSSTYRGNNGRCTSNNVGMLLVLFLGRVGFAMYFWNKLRWIYIFVRKKGSCGQVPVSPLVLFAAFRASLNIRDPPVSTTGEC